MENKENEISQDIAIKKGNNNKARKNVITFSKVMSIILLVLFILCCVGTGVSLIMWIVSFFVDYEWLRNVILQYNPTFDVSKIDLVHAQYSFLTGLFSSGAAGASMFMLKEAFRQIVVDQTPFTKQVVKKMVYAGITTLVVCAFIPLSTGITAAICNAVGQVRDFSITGSWWLLVFGLIIFGLTIILKYGVELQEEADTIL